MADTVMRPYRADDATALTDLLNLADVTAGGTGGFTVDEVRALMSTLVRDHDRDTRMLVAADGTLAASGCVTSPPEGGYRIDLFGAVHPRWRRRGIGREIFGWQVTRAREMHAAAAAPAGWEAHASAIIGDEATIRLFERFGLRPERYFYQMSAATAGVPAIDLPAGLRSAAYHPDLEKAVHAAHVEAFRDHWGYQRRDLDAWTRLTVRTASFRPELSRLALDGDEIVGYVLSYAEDEPGKLYVGQVGTRREWRRRGVAAALLAEVLATAATDGVSLVRLGVDADSPTGAVGVYQRVGFGVELRAVAYALALTG